MSSIFDRPSKFSEAGQEYELAPSEYTFTHHDVQRFTYGQEPYVIAQVPVAGGSKVEVRALAVWWSATHVQIEWTDENMNMFNCWLPKADVKRVDLME
ncbi:hypothetical protein [Arthrobacter sp. 18067]|uniref:hypothetical protein n=1 Tax=Arthrobacter sp. 18067 TaxID=2681413 RepID=UPI00135C1F5B|nr:hypothetical protein [Arthrobacter sp. 18067]